MSLFLRKFLFSFTTLFLCLSCDSGLYIDESSSGSAGSATVITGSSFKASEVSSTTPSTGSLSVSLSTAVKLTLSAPLDSTNSMSISVIPTSSSVGTTSACSSTTADADNQTFTCVKGDLVPNTEYEITATLTFPSASISKALTNTVSIATFTTSSDSGANSAVPTLIIPSFGGDESQSVEIVFDKAMDEDTIGRQSIKIYKSTDTASTPTNLCDTVTYSSTTNRATCTSTQFNNCQEDPTKYIVSVDADSRDTSNNSTTPWSEYFTNIDDGYNNSATIGPPAEALAGTACVATSSAPADANAVNDSDTTVAGKAYVKGSAGVNTISGTGQQGFSSQGQNLGDVGILAKIDKVTGIHKSLDESFLFALSDFTFVEGIFVNLRLGGDGVADYTFATASSGVLSALSPDTDGCSTCLSTIPVYICFTMNNASTAFSASYFEGTPTSSSTYTTVDISSLALPSLAESQRLVIDMKNAGDSTAEVEIDYIRYNIGEAACPPLFTAQ